MTGDIDSSLPVGITHLVDRTNSVCQQHGGVVTQVQFDTLEEMTIEQFIKDVVPTMLEDKDKFTIIKDPVRSTMYRILNGNVACYHITDMKDVFFDSFMDKLLTERPLSITPNLTYPLIHYATNRNAEKQICVVIPSKQFTYHESTHTVDPFLAYHPDLWLYVKLSQANIPTGVRIGVVLDRCDNANMMDVYSLPLPNVYVDNGNICFGGTHFTNPNPNKELSEAAAIEMTYQRIFNSEFNHDLTRSWEEENYMEVCKRLPTYKDFENEYKKCEYGTARFALLVKYAWADRAGVLKTRFRRMCSGKEFLSSI